MATAARSFFRIRYRTAILLLALAMIVWSGFSYWSEYSENSARRARELLAPPSGTYCSIVLSAVDLGLTGMPPRATELNGTATYIRGKIVEQSDHWFVVQVSYPNTPDKQVWIPRERVLLIEFDQ